ncbi:unnamed protein product [Paramecium pentaurelia]|uniref:Uncharacterized protein n=1 Tax=Paramecium pentaurelia TaxID=43138 RepID=A0A8S1TP91_9CILI|nr:unnamed protein product [Paramecium pentaurelia]
MYSFNEFNTGFTILLLILQTSQQLFQLDQNAQQISLNSKWYPVDQYIGTLFKYSPLCDISHIGAVQRNQTNSYLLYLGYERLSETLLFIHYVKFHPEERKIIHIVKLNLKSEIMEEEFEFDFNDYEGKWYMQYMYYDIIQRKIILGFMSKEQKIERSLSSSSFFDQEFKFILGGSLQSFENSFKQDYLLSSFPGKMKLIFLEQNDRKEFYITNLKACESNFEAIMNEFYNFKSQFLKLQVDQEQENQYLIQFWVQLDDVMREIQTIQIIRMYVKYQLNTEKQIELTSFQISYLSDNSKWYYCLQFYSYNYPFIFSTDQIQDFSKIHKYEIEIEFLTSWHFIQVSYQNKQINYIMKNFLLNKQHINQFEKVNQFSCSRFTVTLGQNDSDHLLSGQIQNLKYLNCPSINTSFDHCHHSCQTCYGPNSNHCWSCDETKNRLFNPQTNTCRCKLWYLDLDEVQCHGQSEFNLIETEIQLPQDKKYDEIEPIIQCAFGYFRYLDQCIQCPSASQKGSIQCINCLLFPNTWVYSGKCFEQYQQLDRNEQNTYRYISDIISPESNFYLMIDEELFACDDCQFCSKEEYLEEQGTGITYCILYPLKHMNEDTYILCLAGNLDYETFKCYSKRPVKLNYGSYRGTCNEFCGYCALRNCQYCKDSSLYFSDWQGICRVCNIEHCKYCFSYNQYDLNQVSARKSPLTKLQSNFEEDYIIGCSLCHSGYIFDFTINQCIKKNLQYPCLNAFIKQDNELICTSSSLKARIIEEAQETIGCSTFFQYCVRCVSDNFKMVQCTKCQDGYYLNFLNGICMPCSNIIEHSTKCQMLTSSYDAWKYDVMSFYNNFLPDKVPILVAGYYFIMNVNRVILMIIMNVKLQMINTVQIGLLIIMELYVRHVNLNQIIIDRHHFSIKNVKCAHILVVFVKKEHKKRQIRQILILLLMNIQQTKHIIVLRILTISKLIYIKSQV